MKNIFSIILLALPLFAIGQKATFLSDIQGLINRNVDQITSLAEAIPEDKYSYAPSEGVRTTAKSMLHVASVNYLLGMNLGVPAPEGIDPMKLEGSVDGKTKTIETLKASFDYANGAIAKLKKRNLREKVKLPFGEFTKRQLVLIIYEHSGEHKGQLIAYARANDITPPWSQN